MVDVTYWDSCRFANWLDNGQPVGVQGAGTTETGAYTLNGYTGDDGHTIQRNAGATWAVTSENEWYKAAYYKGGGLNAGYWEYATQSDQINQNMANYGGIGTITDVGSYPYPGAYGTYDQAGDVWNWNESIHGGSYRGISGGSFANNASCMQSAEAGSATPQYGGGDQGFRVVEVPEPSSTIALLGGLVGLLGIRRRAC